jgi:hypothetical protein
MLYAVVGFAHFAEVSVARENAQSVSAETMHEEIFASTREVMGRDDLDLTQDGWMGRGRRWGAGGGLEVSSYRFFC